MAMTVWRVGVSIENELNEKGIRRKENVCWKFIPELRYSTDIAEY